MKVHRIITTIEVENDNSITSIELINLHPANADILLAITDIAIGNDKTSYVSELTTTHLVKQDDVGMTVVTGIDTDIGHGDLLS